MSLNLEEEFLFKIEKASDDFESAKREIEYYKKSLIDAESKLIESSLLKKKLTEQLRRYRLSLPSSEDETKLERQEEIREFKKRLPEILKKLDGDK